jgi:hypothetical protein
MKFSKEELAGVASRLRELPAKEEARNHTKRDAVLVLSTEISQLKERGYTLEQIAEALSASGLPISTPTLKNYLQRAKNTARMSSGSKRSTPRRAQGKQSGKPRVAFEPTADSDEI